MPSKETKALTHYVSGAASSGRKRRKPFSQAFSVGTSRHSAGQGEDEGEESEDNGCTHNEKSDRGKGTGMGIKAGGEQRRKEGW